MTTRSGGEIPVRRRDGGIPSWLLVVGLILLALIALVLLGVIDLGAMGGGGSGSGAGSTTAPDSSWIGGRLG